MKVRYEFREDDTHLVQMRGDEEADDAQRFVEFYQDEAGISILVKDPALGIRDRHLVLLGEEVELLAAFLRGEEMLKESGESESGPGVCE